MYGSAHHNVYRKNEKFIGGKIKIIYEMYGAWCKYMHTTNAGIRTSLRTFTHDAKVDTEQPLLRMTRKWTHINSLLRMARK